MQPMVDFKEIAPLIEKAMEYQNKGYGTVFVYLQGHIAKLSIDLCPHGWSFSKLPDHELWIYLTVGDGFCKEDVQQRITDIQYIMDTQLTVEQHEAMVQRINEEFERKQYEKLKEKFGDV